ncbi:MAG: hypothetical protein PHX04_03170 [Bacilli bacterium]|nr:hypothetical protein [Bacilli bacterium]
MITNIANLVYDLDEIKNRYQSSNMVSIYKYFPILNIIVGWDTDYISIYILNNTSREIKYLQIFDINNDIIKNVPELPINILKIITYNMNQIY